MATKALVRKVAEAYPVSTIYHTTYLVCIYRIALFITESHKMHKHKYAYDHTECSMYVYTHTFPWQMHAKDGMHTNNYAHLRLRSTDVPVDIWMILLWHNNNNNCQCFSPSK
jgi:hypothetical protein